MSNKYWHEDLEARKKRNEQEYKKEMVWFNRYLNSIAKSKEEVNRMYKRYRKIKKHKR